MAIPTYEELLLPLLKIVAADNKEKNLATCVPVLAQAFSLTELELSQRLPSGRQTTFRNRCGWAKSYLTGAKLLETTRRGYFRATAEGRTLLAEHPGHLDRKTLMGIPAFASWWSGSDTDSSLDPNLAPLRFDTPSAATPDDLIDEAVSIIGSTVENDLLARVRTISPDRFEQIVVDLLLAMGYGGGNPDMGQRLGGSGDGGIDGVIQEDALGLDAVYVQAKRYRDGNNIGAETIRGFVGSLVGARASKGVFVCASKFTSDAKNFAAQVQHRIVLIDGEELARLLIRHGVGVRVARTIAIKKIDEDYFSDE